jgi:hypothetical protein
MRFFLAIIALLFITSAGHGQDYIVTMKNDTIRGDVRILSYDAMDRVQLAQGKKKTIYTAVQIRLLSYMNEFYSPVKYDNAIRMMKIIRKGFLSLYAFKFPNQTGFDGRLLVKVGSSPQEVPNLGFKKYVGNLVEDCPVVAEKVRNGDLDRRNVEQLVVEYNECVANTQAQRFDAAASKATNPTTDFIEELRERVNKSDLSTKNEVNDLLNSIAEKVRKNEPVPAYMKDGLKGYLSVRDEFREDTEQLLSLLNN